MNYVYILECSDGTLYTGWTNNLERRFEVHSRGRGGKYTRARLPVKLLYFEEYENRIDAQKREYEVKQMTRSKKLELIKFGRSL